MFLNRATKVSPFLNFEFPSQNIWGYLTLDIVQLNFFCKFHQWNFGLVGKTPAFGAEGPGFKSRGHHFFFIFLHQMQHVYHSEANFLNSSMPEQSFISKNIQNQTFLSQRNLKTQGLETCDDLFRRWGLQSS